MLRRGQCPHSVNDTGNNKSRCKHNENDRCDTHHDVCPNNGRTPFYRPGAVPADVMRVTATTWTNALCCGRTVVPGGAVPPTRGSQWQPPSFLRTSTA